MSEELAARDAYVQSAEGEVVEVRPEGIILSRTPFYARGGGQPGDIGLIRCSDGEVRVIDTIRSGGEVLHLIEGETRPRPGVEVEAEIDWQRRYRLMRTHTALHALSGVVWRDYGAKVTGGNMDPGAARMDFELEAMSLEFGRQVEAILNQELVKGYPVEVLLLARDLAFQDPDLIRTKVNLIPDYLKEIRVIDIVGLDKQADGGTHVRSTLEVGRVRVAGTESKGKANKRIRIELD